jgi:ethanolamine utilization protein EutN
MEIGKVIGTVIATVKHECYEGKRLLVVQQLGLDGKPQGSPRIAIDYVNAGVGDLVLIGGAPGVAALVFGVEKAPIKDLIMGIIDRVDVGNQLVMTLYDDLPIRG